MIWCYISKNRNYKYIFLEIAIHYENLDDHPDTKKQHTPPCSHHLSPSFSTIKPNETKNFIPTHLTWREDVMSPLLVCSSLSFFHFFSIISIMYCSSNVWSLSTLTPIARASSIQNKGFKPIWKNI